MTGGLLQDPGPGTPLFSPILIPSLPSLNLSEAEKNLIGRLQARAFRQRALMQLTNAYYLGEQLVVSLGIAIPPELSGLRTIVGWPAIAIDPLEERLAGQGFRLPDETDVDEDLATIWDANSLDAEQSLVHVDALSMGRAYLTIGSSYDPTDDMPVICAESPLNISALWDVRSFKPTAVLQTYWLDQQRHAALYLPDQTIHIGEDDRGVWQITDRDQHNFGEVPVVRVSNRPRSNNRDGASEITPAIMSITDAACRTLLGLEIAREFYSVPQKYILGATESDFQDAQGNTKTAWQTYISHIMGLERDDEGNLPTVGQFQAYDPAAFTKVIDMYASKMSGIIGVPPQDLGLYTEGNPVNADAILYTEQRRTRRARRKQAQWGPSWVRAMQLALRFKDGNDSALADKYKRMAMEWADPATPTPGATTDALQKQVAAGMVPPTSDVVLGKAGYTPIERQRMEQDRQLDVGAQVLAELAHSLQAKQARTDLAVTNDIAGGAAPPTPTPGQQAQKKPISANPRAGYSKLAR